MVPKLWLIVTLVTTHHLAFFGGLRYLRSNIFLLHIKSEFLSLPPEWVIPTVGIVAISHGRSCDVHRFGRWNVLLLVRTTHGFGGLLHWPRNGTEAVTTCVVLALARDHLKFLVCKLISFILNLRKSSTS